MSDRIQAFEFAWYNTGRADLLMFLKYQRFNDFPITKGQILWDPVALAQNRMEMRVLSYKIILNKIKYKFEFNFNLIIKNKPLQ